MNGKQKEKEKIYYKGFERPESNFFRMPNDWTDLTAKLTSLAEIKVVEYVLRHTWGYQEFGVAKKITTDEFMKGRKRQDGKRMDVGTGLSNRSVIDGLRLAVEHGLLQEQIDDRDKARIKKYYSLRMLPTSKVDGDGGEEDSEANQAAMKNLHSGVKVLHNRYVKSSQRTEKETLEKHLKKQTVATGNEHQTKNVNLLTTLPTINQSKEKTLYIAQYILGQLKDQHSHRFYQLIASKIPEHVIRQALSEIKTDGARHPAKVFVYKIKKRAMTQAASRLVKNF